MNLMALLGILCFLYSAVVIYLALKKPPAIWNMAKIQFFIKVLGEKGTVIFFFVLAIAVAGLGVWLLL